MFHEIESAYSRLKPVVRETPLEYSKEFSRISKNNIYLKLENKQLTGSFKVRGAYNLMSKIRRGRVITASAGNHAQGVAYSARLLGMKATVVMPEHTPLIKITATKNYGAEVILSGSGFDEAYAKARQLQKAKGLFFVHPFDDLDVIFGQGTIGLELINQLPNLEAIVVPVGGGGLISGIALALKSINKKIKVIGVQAKGACPMYQSLKQGRLMHIRSSSTIADGIAVKFPGRKTFNIIKKHVDDIVLVDDDEISDTIIKLLETHKLIAEPAGAASLAAVLHHKLRLRNRNIAVVISGGNMDIKTLDTVLRLGLTKAGRLFSFKTVIENKPGSLNALLSLLLGVNILTINEKRLIFKDIEHVEVELVLETSDKMHIKSIIKKLKNSGYKVAA